jgi:hypothetical protein
VAALLRLCSGLQLLDDLHDCIENLTVNNMTWPVTSAQLAYPDRDVTDPGAIMTDIAARRVHACGSEPVHSATRSP